jgi:hypothetical protein
LLYLRCFNKVLLYIAIQLSSDDVGKARNAIRESLSIVDLLCLGLTTERSSGLSSTRSSLVAAAAHVVVSPRRQSRQRCANIMPGRMTRRHIRDSCDVPSPHCASRSHGSSLLSVHVALQVLSLCVLVTTG